MENAERYLTLIVLLNAAIVVFHGLAHLEVGILPAFLDDTFIGTVIGLAPIIGLMLVLRGWRRVGGSVLLISMASSLIYGVYNHFLISGSDNAFMIRDGGWAGIFLSTALLLPAAEIVGLVAGVLLIL